jgi:hypothetical protein
VIAVMLNKGFFISIFSPDISVVCSHTWSWRRL